MANGFNPDNIAAAASSKTYRKVNKTLAKVYDVRVPRTRSPRRDFEGMVDRFKKRALYSQRQLKLWAETMTKAGLHPRFPRFE